MRLKFRKAGPIQPLVFWLLVHVPLLVEFVAGQPTGAGIVLRGMSPEGVRYFHEQQRQQGFKCRDGGTLIGLSRVNDDFCDCPDGSDEPGTSACSNGSFYCTNAGHKPLQLPASRVNDRICDCCDGSDEWLGRAKCPNTCLEAGSAHRATLARDVQAYNEGLKARKTLRGTAKNKRWGWVTELKQLKEARVQQDTKVAALKVAMDRLEQAERKEQEWLAKKKEEEEAAAAAARGPAAAAGPSDIEGVSEGPTEAGTHPGEVGAEAVDESAAEAEAAGGGGGEAHMEGSGGEVQIEQSAGGVEEEALSAEEIGKRIRARWTGEQIAESPAGHQAEQAAGDASEVTEEVDVEDDEILEEVPGDGGEEEEDDDGGDGATRGVGEAAPSPPSVSFIDQLLSYPKSIFKKAVDLVSPPLPPQPPQHVRQSDLDKARTEHREAVTKQAKINAKITELEANVGREYGPDDIFVSLVDQCFELNEKQYTYKVCPFKDAMQTENGVPTRLGNWEGFTSNFSEMEFKHGQVCWNGPARSLKVRLQCGAKMELEGVEEPSRCEYTAVLVTPVACAEAEGERLKAQLDSVERVARAVKAEL